MEKTFSEVAFKLRVDAHSAESMKSCLTGLKEVRDRLLETTQTTHYTVFLRIFYPCFEHILTVVVPQFQDGLHHQIRNIVLDVVHRLPQNEVLRGLVGKILNLATVALERDNEENALICLRIIFDLHKTYRPSLEDQVRLFLNFVKSSYESTPITVQRIFQGAGLVQQQQQQQRQQQPQDKEKDNKPIQSSKESFRVLTECPLIVMLLFQLHPRIVPDTILPLVPLMVNAIRLEPDQKMKIINGLKTDVRTRYSELLACQVKTLSFLTYLIRSPSYLETMRRHESAIAYSVLLLLQGCPPEAISIRKDLLIATRHILATEFRNGFKNLIDQLLDESVLLGGSHWIGVATSNYGNTSHLGAQPVVPQKEYQILPLAYSTLADLIHHVRSQLTLTQLSKVVYIFTRNLHDHSLPLNTQSTSVRLLLNLVDCIFHNKEPEPNSGRTLLVQILHTLVQKLSALREIIPEVVQEGRMKRKQRKQVAASSYHLDPLDAYYYTTGGTSPQQQSPSPASKPPLQRADSSMLQTPKLNRLKSVDLETPKATSTTPSDSTKKSDPGSSIVSPTNGGNSNSMEQRQLVFLQLNQEQHEEKEDSNNNKRRVSELVTNATTKDESPSSSNNNEENRMLYGAERWSFDPAKLLDVEGEDGYGQGILGSSIQSDADKVKEVKSLLSTMILGLKTVLWCICNYGQKKLERDLQQHIGGAGAGAGAGSTRPPGATGFLKAPEMALIGDLLEYGFQCICVFRHGTVDVEDIYAFDSDQSGLGTRSSSYNDSKMKQQPPGSQSKKGLDSFHSAFHVPSEEESKMKSRRQREEKAIEVSFQSELEILNQFAEIFTMLDPHDFADVFRAKMPVLFANLVRHPVNIAFPKRLLRKNSISHSFLNILLEFCCDHMPSLTGQYGLVTAEATKDLLWDIDLGNIIVHPPRAVVLENVPIGGPDAAASLYGLGIGNRIRIGGDLSLTTEGMEEPIEAPVHTNGVDDTLHEKSFHELLIEGQAAAVPNEIAVLTQLLEASFNCVENYSDDNIAGPAPSYLSSGGGGGGNSLHQQQQSQQQSGARLPGGLNAGWTVASILQSNLEKLMVLSLVLAPAMNTSSHASLRKVERSETVEKFLATDGAGDLLNEGRGKMEEQEETKGITSLGRDCFLLVIRGILRVIARRHILQELAKASMTKLMIPALRSLNAILSQAQTEKVTKDSVVPSGRADLVAEVILLLAVRIPRTELRHHLPILQNAFEVALGASSHRNVELVRLALRILESWVDHLGPENFDALFLHKSEPGRETFAHVIGNLLRPSPQPCGTGALRLLGKLGKRARTALLSIPSETILLPKPKSKALIVEMLWTTTSSPKMELCLDQIIVEAKAFLDDTFRPNIRTVHLDQYFEMLGNGHAANLGNGFGKNSSNNNNKVLSPTSVASKRQRVDAGIHHPTSIPFPKGSPTAYHHNNEDRHHYYFGANMIYAHHLHNLEDQGYYKQKAVDLLFTGLAHFVDTKQIIETLPGNHDGDDHSMIFPSLQESILDGFIQGKHDNIPFADECQTAKSSGLLEWNEDQRNLATSILHGLSVACCDIDVGKVTWPTFKGVIQLLTIAMMRSAVKTSDGGKPLLSTGIDAKQQPKIMASNSSRGRTSSFNSDYMEPENHANAPPVRLGQGLDATILTQVAVEMLSTASPVFSRFGVHMVDTILATANEILSDRQQTTMFSQTSASPVIVDLVERLADKCHHFSWTAQLGGCIGLRHLINKVPKDWFSNHFAMVIDPLVHVLQGFQIHLGLDVLLHCSSALQELIVTMLYQTTTNAEDDSTILESIISSLLKIMLAWNRQARQIGVKALSLVAKLKAVTVGTMLNSFPKQIEWIKTRLFAKSVRKELQHDQVPLMEMITFLLEQEPSPLAFLFEEESSKQSAVQTMTEAIIFAETAERNSGEWSFSKAMAFVEPGKGKGRFGDSKTSRGCIYAGPYPFNDIPDLVGVRAAAIDLVGAILQRGGGGFLSHLNEESVSQKVRDRAVKLVVSSSISCWPTVANAAQRALPVIAICSRTPIGGAGQDMMGIPQQTLQTYVNMATTSFVGRGVTPSHAMIHGSMSIVNAFEDTNKQLTNTFANNLVALLKSVLTSIPLERLLSLNGPSAMENPLDPHSVAAEIIQAFGNLNPTLVQNQLKTLVHHVIRIENAHEVLVLDKLNHQLPSSSSSAGAPPGQGDAQDGNQSTNVSTAPFFYLHGFLSSPVFRAFQSIASRIPKLVLNLLLQNENIRNAECMRMLTTLLGMPEGLKLREELMKPEMMKHYLGPLFQIAFMASVDPQSQSDVILLCFQGVELVSKVISHEPNWLLQNPWMIETLIKIWRHDKIINYLHMEEQLSWAQRGYYQQICTIFTVFYRAICKRLASSSYGHDMSEFIQHAAAIPYEMLTLAVLRTTIDNTFLLQFYKNDVGTTKSKPLRIAVIKRYIGMMKHSSLSSHIKEAAIRLVLLPTLTISFQLDPKFGTGEGEPFGRILIKEIASIEENSSNNAESGVPTSSSSAEPLMDVPDVAPPVALFEPTNASAEALQVQMLKLGTSLIAFYGEQLVDIRKELIKFAWNHLKNDDSPCKLWAYINICTFIHTYQTPPEIVLQVYVALLKEHAVESRAMVRRALDILIPSLSKRLPVSRFIRAVRFTKKVILDEGHKLPQLIHIWQLISRHPEMFYQNRNHFVPQIIQSMNKLWSPQNGTNENRALAVRLAEMFLSWEQTTLNEQRYWKRLGLDENNEELVLTDRQAAAKESLTGFRGNMAMLTVVVHFLMRLTLLLSDMKDAEGMVLYRKCINLFKLSLQYAGELQKQSSTANSPGEPGNSSGRGVTSNKSIIKFPYIAKHIEAVKIKIKERQQNEGGSGGKTGGSSSISSSTGKDSKHHQTPTSVDDHEKPGMLSCILDIINIIISSDMETIAQPFVRENEKFLPVILSPMFASSERPCREKFLQLMRSLRQVIPVPKAIPDSNQELTPGTFFYAKLFASMESRLNIASDDAKRGMLAAQQSRMQQEQEMGGGKGKAPAKEGKKSKKTASASQASSSKGAISIQIKASQQKAIEAALKKSRDEVGAGPLGTLQTLRLAQLLCAKGDRIEIVEEPESGDTIVQVEDYEPQIVDRLIVHVMKILHRAYKELIAGSGMRARAATKTAGSLGGSPTILGCAPREPSSSKDIPARTACVCIELLAPRVLCHDQYRKSFLAIIQNLIDKLDVYDDKVLMTILKLANEWILAPLDPHALKPGGGPKKAMSSTESPRRASANRLSMKERQQLVVKLEQLERFDGLPFANELVQKYYDMVYKVFEPNSIVTSALNSSSKVGTGNGGKVPWSRQIQARFLAGLLSHDVYQRKQFYRAYSSTRFTGNSPFAKMQLIIQQDWSHLSSKNWIAVATQILLSSINPGSLVALSSKSGLSPLGLPHQRNSNSNSNSKNNSQSMEVDGNNSSNNNGEGVLRNIQSSLRYLEEVKADGQGFLDSMQELGYGDADGKVSAAVWVEAFSQAWRVFEEQQQMLLTEGLQVLLTRSYHLPQRALFFEGIQKSAVVIQHALEEITTCTSKSKKHHVLKGRVNDPFQEILLLAAFRRTRTWSRLQGWQAENVISTFIKSIMELNPLPIISGEVLQYVGRTFRCKELAICLSEKLLQQVEGVKTRNRVDVIHNIENRGFQNTDLDLSPKKSVHFPKTTSLVDNNKPSKKLGGTKKQQKQSKKQKTSSALTKSKKDKKKNKKKDKAAAASDAVAVVVAAAAAKKHAMDIENAERWARTLLKLYDGENDDMIQGAIRQFSSTAVTFAGLAQEASSHWQDAWNVYVNGIDRVDSFNGTYPLAKKRLIDHAYQQQTTRQSSSYSDHAPPHHHQHQPQDQELGGFLGGFGFDGGPGDDLGFLDAHAGELDNFFDGMGLDFEDPFAPLGGGGSGGAGGGPAEFGGMMISPTNRNRASSSSSSSSSHLSSTSSASGYEVIWIPKVVCGLEFEVWRHRWERCARRLGEWDQLKEIAQDCNDVALLAESTAHAGKSGWVQSVRKSLDQQMRRLQEKQHQMHLDRTYLPLNTLANLLSPRMALLNVVAAINESRSAQELDHVWRQAANSILLEWGCHQAPTVGDHRRSLLYSCQKLVELEESIAYLGSILSMTDTGKGKPGGGGGGKGGKLEPHQQMAPANMSAKVNQISRMLHRWRERVPFHTEDPEDANGLFLSRLSVFQIGVNSFQGHQNPAMAGATVPIMSKLSPPFDKILQLTQDVIWTLFEESRMFRDLGLIDQSFQVLATGEHMFPRDLTPEESFNFLRERALNILQCDKSSMCTDRIRHLGGGLAELLELDISSYTPKMKAEFMRLRARYQEALGDDAQVVHDSYSQAVNISGNNPDVWLDWGRFCDRLIQNKETNTAIYPHPDSELGPLMIGSFLQAIRGGNEVARLYIPSILWRIHVDGSSSAASTDNNSNNTNTPSVCTTLSRYFTVIPSWVWLPYIPQLLGALCLGSPITTTIKPILMAIAQEYPNAYYYHLRNYYVERENEQRSLPKDSEAASTNAQTVALAKSLVSHFHQTHPKLILELEPMIDAISTASKNQHPYDELHSTLHRVLDKCVQFATGACISSNPDGGAMDHVFEFDGGASQARKMATAFGVGVAADLDVSGLSISSERVRVYHTWNMLERVCSKLFSKQSMDRSKLHTVLLTRIKDRFEGDFKPLPDRMTALKESDKNEDIEQYLRDPPCDPSFPDGRDMSLEGLILRLGRWKGMLMDILYVHTPERLPMYKWSKDLSQMKPIHVQIPGMHALKDGLGKPKLSNHPQCRGFGQFVHIGKEDGYSQPTIGFLTEDGQELPFTLRSGTSQHIKSDQRSIQLRTMLNGLFERTNETKRRQYIRFALPVVVPIHSRLQIQFEGMESKRTSLGSIFEQEMHKEGINGVDTALPAFYVKHLKNHLKQLNSKQQGQPITVEDQVKARCQTLQSMKRLVPDSLLSRYLLSRCESYQHYQSFRDVMTRQYALSSFMTFLLSGFERNPYKTVIDRNGFLYEIDLRPSFKLHSMGELENSANEVHVPFRLTQNIEHFFTPHGIAGSFHNSLQAIGSSLVEEVNKPILRSTIELLMLHELVDYNVGIQANTLESSLFNNAKVHQVLKVNRDVMLTRVDMLAKHVEVEPTKSDLMEEDLEDSTTTTTLNRQPPQGMALIPMATPQEIERMIPSRSVNASCSPFEPVPRDETLAKLILEARNEQRISLMDLTWQPLF